MEKRAASSSARPRTVMAHELVGFANVPSQTNDPVLHKKYRRMYATAISTRTAERYWGVQVRALRRATLDMLADAGRWTPALKRAVASISFMVAYGYDVDSEKSDLVTGVNEILRIFERVIQPGVWIVDIIPALKYLPPWFPGAGFKRMAKQWRTQIEEVRQIPMQRVKQELAAGTAKPSFSLTLLEELALDPHANVYDEDFIRDTAASIYSAGSDTSVAAIQTFLAAMVLYPDVQRKSQAELDAVVGRDRLPTINDREHLPYCAAIVQEILRWHPVTPLALPHVLEQDELFEGYLMPKGAVLLGNVWAMSRDERVYPLADDFVPERHLTREGAALRTPDTGRYASLTFGFGRRVCPGYALAEASVFAAVISFLWTCSLSRTPGTEEVPIEFEVIGVHRPKDFRLDVKERFPGAADLVRTGIDINE
ncbi:cytochrome P450 [Dacryopinax primogenitus]|uniref:Cytochrome P450 n=1 Tax=Dacryopinax primogenitus (strain DJM 731) TaxID=1858805 RepID=M5FSP5_DACPD|nr:cytochrome P450 [Dacryopinax primogenitus]EJT98958.1 cytochrome P450 [Dacryopinax primogenitus]